MRVVSVHCGLPREVVWHGTAAGDKASAQKAYDEFFTMWKNADSDIPILKQARAEYAKLP